MTIDTPRELNALSRQYFNVFLEKVFAEISPGDEYSDNWHIETMAWHLQEAFEGRIKRLIINLPPRSLKSIAASVALPAWAMGRDPTKRFICASYGQDLATSFSLDTRRVMQSSWYTDIFPATVLSVDKNTGAQFGTTQKGSRFATSVGGAITGFGADVIIIDDPLKPGEVNSEKTREDVKNWFSNSVLTRLNDPKSGVIIVVMQRLHEDDLTGHLLEQEGWTHVRLPAIAEEAKSYPLYNGRVHKRAPLEFLQPARMGKVELDELRKQLGTSVFEAQYQQNPIPPGGNLLRWDWFRFYEKPPGDFEFIIQSWDPATTQSSTASWSVCTTWGVRGTENYLLDVWRGRVEFPELIRRILGLDVKYKPDLLIVEVAGVGRQVVQTLRSEHHMTHVQTVEVKRGKVERAESVTPLLEQGKVLLPSTAPWLEAFRNETKAFPEGRHDDQVDSITQFLGYRQRALQLARPHRRPERAGMPDTALTPRSLGTFTSLGGSSDRLSFLRSQDRLFNSLF